ncbi:MAG: F0F1 ATP synthase subunit B', partial [Pseudomonadota bacterium]
MTGQAAHAASEGGLPQLDTSSFASQIFWLVVCFACFYLVLARIAMPRISET